MSRWPFSPQVSHLTLQKESTEDGEDDNLKGVGPAVVSRLTCRKPVSRATATTEGVEKEWRIKKWKERGNRNNKEYNGIIFKKD